MWQQMSSSDFKVRFVKSSYYITHICNEYGVLKRTANTIYKSIIGKQKALMELKKLELSNTRHKISRVIKDIARYKERINTLKVKVKVNKATERELERYRTLKRGLYKKQGKYNRLKQRADVLDEIITNKKYAMCFGSKKAYKAQWQLGANGYNTRDKWYNDFVKSRDKAIEYLGSADESYGNQMCQLIYDEISSKFSLQLRKENKYVSENKYLVIDNIDFKYMKTELVEICKQHKEKGVNRKALTYRFRRKNNKWYLQVMFAIERIPITRKNNGVIGLDFNVGFIEGIETDKAGNIVCQYHFDLKYHGCGNKAKTEMAEVVSRIANVAVRKGKDIVVEVLHFDKKKAKVGADKAYNKMIHTLDYSRYGYMLQNACHRKQVGLLQVNPAYTSVIGERKYGKARKLNRHQAASYVIARLGQGYKDMYGKYATVL